MTTTSTSETRPVEQQPLLVGIGSALGDDQAGWTIVELIRDRWGDEVSTRLTSVPLDLLDWITPATGLHIVDACDGNETPGHLYRWDWHPGTFFHSSAFALRGTGTHDFDVVSVLELARRLGRLPQSVTIWGVQGERWEESESLSPTVAAVVPDVSELIGKELVDARTITGTFTADAGSTTQRSATGGICRCRYC